MFTFFADDPVSLPNPAWVDFLIRYGAGLLIFLTTTVVSFALGRLIGAWRARQQYRNRHFLGRINIGLTSLREDNTLRIRTLMERSLEEVFLNPIAVDRVLSAAKRTTLENSLLPIAKEDRWFLLSFVLNAVSEHFSPGVIRQDTNQDVKCFFYLLFLTCEVEGEDRIRKVRAIMVREEVLRKVSQPATHPACEVSNHADRLVTLRKAAEMYQVEPDLFIRMEVCA